ncbi:hypothetical protein [Bryobacter aggregatus]|uniref:hypothetical protein n=1 Tax=Bryobacter aggregatus TaxID=360054 RepID=UPI0004E279BC|nr:hypothetical protein [Bryobacter aggregatus]
MKTTIKRTTVYISMGDSTQVYRSPDEIPAKLRKQLVLSTRGMNSATILIADRGGREEIRKILNGEPSPLKSRLRPGYLKRSLGIAEETSESGEGHSEAAPELVPTVRTWGLRNWAELLLPGLVGIGLWVLFTR